MKTRKKSIVGLSLLAASALVIIWVLWGNTALTVHEIAVTSGRLPEAFSGFRITQISDLHHAEFGAENETLLRFLQYDAGLYTDEATNMVVSRGNGNSIIPLRINNRPEIVVAELSCAHPVSG